MRKVIALAMVAALATSAPVSAGEYAGNGKYVPGGDNGASMCSYSGRNDDDDGQGFTQTFAAFVRFIGATVGYDFNAGRFCRGNG